jgi:hypothetical protein
VIYQGRKKYPVNEICLHTAAVPTGWAAKRTVEQARDEIRDWHIDRGWRDIGYHYIIGSRGGLAHGRPNTQVGAGVRGHNRGVIHVCMPNKVAHHGVKDFDTYFTTEQRETLVALIQTLQLATDITKISGHNEYAAKECPGFYVQQDEELQSLLGKLSRYS